VKYIARSEAIEQLNMKSLDFFKEMEVYTNADKSLFDYAKLRKGLTGLFDMNGEVNIKNFNLYLKEIMPKILVSSNRNPDNIKWVVAYHVNTNHFSRLSTKNKLLINEFVFYILEKESIKEKLMTFKKDLIER